MRNLSSPSTSNADYFQSNNTSQKGLSDNDNDCFPRNGFPDDSPPTKDEDRTNDVHGKRDFQYVKLDCFMKKSNKIETDQIRVRG